MSSDNQSSDADDSNTEQKDGDATSEEREQIRKEISTMSFEDLQKLKEKIGSCVFNETVFGGVKARKPKTNFKRANKNRPREMSSKKRIDIRKQVTQVKKQVPRDPRFDSLCGTFEEKTFKSNYKFLHDLRKNERVQLAKAYKKTDDPGEKRKIKFVMQRLDNQIREREKREASQNKEREEKRQIKDKLRIGEKPVFKKKSERKLEDLIEKYEELKKTNRLQKHIEKRTKKLLKKDRKNMSKHEQTFFL